MAIVGRLSSPLYQQETCSSSGRIKNMILSNIAVHIEQNPTDSTFFNPENEKKLANKNFKEEDFINYLYKNKIKVSSNYGGEFRFVTHYWITKDKIDYLVDIVIKYLKAIGLC